MNKRLVVILLVAFLFVVGAISLFADEEAVPSKDTADNHELIEPHIPESQPNPCGEGNGGGGDPG